MEKNILIQYYYYYQTLLIQPHQLKRNVSRVTHPLVVQMRSVKREMELGHVHVYQNTSETHTLDVDPNAYRTLIAIDQKRARIISVETLALEFAE